MSLWRSPNVQEAKQLGIRLSFTKIRITFRHHFHVLLMTLIKVILVEKNMHRLSLAIYRTIFLF